jgi:hypothetical protein
VLLLARLLLCITFMLRGRTLIEAAPGARAALEHAVAGLEGPDACSTQNAAADAIKEALRRTFGRDAPATQA